MSTRLSTHSPFKNQSKYKHCTLYIAHYTLYIALCTLHIAHCTSYNSLQFVLPGQCFHLKRLVLPDSIFPDDVVTDDLSRA